MTYNLYDNKYEAIILHQNFCKFKGIEPENAITSPSEIYNFLMKIG